MTAEQLKIKVKEAFTEVSSKEFLDIKIKEKVQQLEHEFLRWKTSNPNCSLNDFKQWEVQAINTQTTNSNEIMAIGIYLLALDNLKI